MVYSIATLDNQLIILHRNQNTGKKLPLDDKDLFHPQKKLRIQNHPVSSKSKGRGGQKAKVAPFAVGNLVFLKSERTKFKCRDQFIVFKVLGQNATAEKLHNSKFMSRQYIVPLDMLFPVTDSLKDSSMIQG